jgi:hypothetical protein
LAAFLLVTIVHVLVFTGAFILYGALKKGSRIAVLSLCVFAACVIAAATVPAAFAPPSGRIQELYSGFEQLNRELLRLAGLPRRVYDSSGVAAIDARHRVRVPVSLPELVLQGFDHPLARSQTYPRRYDPRNLGDRRLDLPLQFRLRFSTCSSCCTSCSNFRSVTRRS